MNKSKTTNQKSINTKYLPSEENNLITENNPAKKTSDSYLLESIIEKPTKEVKENQMNRINSKRKERIPSIPSKKENLNVKVNKKPFIPLPPTGKDKKEVVNEYNFEGENNNSVKRLTTRSEIQKSNFKKFNDEN